MYNKVWLFSYFQSIWVVSQPLVKYKLKHYAVCTWKQDGFHRPTGFWAKSLSKYIRANALEKNSRTNQVLLYFLFGFVLFVCVFTMQNINSCLNVIETIHRERAFALKNVRRRVVEWKQTFRTPNHAWDAAKIARAQWSNTSIKRVYIRNNAKAVQWSTVCANKSDVSQVSYDKFTGGIIRFLMKWPNFWL